MDNSQTQISNRRRTLRPRKGGRVVQGGIALDSPEPVQSSQEGCNLEAGPSRPIRHVRAKHPYDKRQSQQLTSPSKTNKEKTPIRIECVICGESFERTACLCGTCGHFICSGCIVSMAEVATRDESLIPVKCCQKRLPQKGFLGFLPDVLRKTFSAKCAEARTSPGRRIYCPKGNCSSFIGRSSKPYLSLRVRVLTCTACGTKVCSACKKDMSGHERTGKDCWGIDTHEVQAFVEENGWKYCPECGVIVERVGGCNHMVCRCGASFCYGCGKKWHEGFCSLPLTLQVTQRIA